MLDHDKYHGVRKSVFERTRYFSEGNNSFLRQNVLTQVTAPFHQNSIVISPFVGTERESYYVVQLINGRHDVLSVPQTFGSLTHTDSAQLSSI